jgi:hypothetical protein
MEADRPEITTIEGGLDRWAAARAVGRAEWLEAPGALAGGEAGVSIAESRGERAQQRGGHEWHVPRNRDDGGGCLEDGGVDPAQRAKSRTYVGDHPKAGMPLCGVRVIGDEQRGLTQSLLKRGDEAIEDAGSPDAFEPLGPAAEPGGRSTGDDRSVDAMPGVRQ